MTVVVSEQANALILLRVAKKTVDDARRAWKSAASSKDAAIIRSAFRACMLAARSARNAATASSARPIAAARLTAQADKLDAAAAELKHRLVS